MQSFLQYRRIHRSVICRIEGDTEKALHECHLPQLNIGIDAQSPRQGTKETDGCICEHLSDPENIAQAPIRLVEWDDYDAHLNPHQYTVKRKAAMTFMVAVIAIAVTASSAIDASDLAEYSAYFEVSKVVGSCATGMFTIVYPNKFCLEADNMEHCF